MIAPSRILEIAERACGGPKIPELPHPGSKVLSERMLNLAVLFDAIDQIAAAGCFRSLAQEAAQLEKDLHEARRGA